MTLPCVASESNKLIILFRCWLYNIALFLWAGVKIVCLPYKFLLLFHIHCLSVFPLDGGHCQPLRAHRETWKPPGTLLPFYSSHNPINRVDSFFLLAHLSIPSAPILLMEFRLLLAFAWTGEIFLWHVPISELMNSNSPIYIYFYIWWN